MITVRHDHLAALPHAAEDSGNVYLFYLPAPATFAANLPVDFRPPTSLNPGAGLPANVWVGMEIFTEEDARAAERLLDVHARIRWIDVGYVSLKTSRALADLFTAWRCQNCGRRGSGRRPKLCPHAQSLCGDAKILSQIHWLRGKDHSGHLRSAAQEYGLVIEPEIPIVKELEI